MEANQDKTIYLIPGLGADGTIFKYLSFPEGFNIKHVEWIKPHNHEPITDYCMRLHEQIQDPSKSIIVGLSFGGMIAGELAKQLNPSKTIIISSIKTRFELSPLQAATALFNPQRYVPSVLAIRFEFWYEIALGPLTPEDKAWVRTMALGVDPDFTDWAAETAIHWQNETHVPDLVHIHGDNDFLFPARYIKNYINIPGGTHYMVANRAAEISEIIKKTIQ